jgi:hypothetical protein
MTDVTAGRETGKPKSNSFRMGACGMIRTTRMNLLTAFWLLGLRLGAAARPDL